MTEILFKNPLIKGIVADTPQVIPETKKMILARGVEDRCQALECDFFREIPAGSVAYLMSHVLHDWSDEQCRTILANCHRAMKAESRLLVVEMVIPPGNEPAIAKLLDLEMLVTTGGRERTEKEFNTLLEYSGYTVSRIIDTNESICIIEGLRV